MSIVHGGSQLLLFIVLFLLAKWIKEFSTPYDVNANLTEKDNPALAVSVAGYFFAVTIVFLGAYIGPSRGILADLSSVGTYSLLGILLLNLSRNINDKFILHQFSDRKEIIEDRNAGTGAVVLGSYIASALIIAGSVHGEFINTEMEAMDEIYGYLTAVTFFLIGQLVLIIFAKIYEAMTHFSVHDEIEKDNVAAGLGFAGNLVAIGIIIMAATSGDFLGWKAHLIKMGGQVVFIFLFLIVLRFFFDKVIISKADLTHEIRNDKNLGAGLLEFAIAVSFATVLFFII